MRLRSTLRTYGPLWLGGRGAVRRQLAWYARLLGTSRDLEVVSAWLAELRSDPQLAEVPASDLEDLYEHALSRRTAALSTLRQELHREPFDTLAALLFGGDPAAARELGGAFSADREADASHALSALAH